MMIVAGNYLDCTFHFTYYANYWGPDPPTPALNIVCVGGGGGGGGKNCIGVGIYGACIVHGRLHVVALACVCVIRRLSVWYLLLLGYPSIINPQLLGM